MSNQIKLNQALELTKNKKYKKALQLVKKINHKRAKQTFLSWMIEGECYVEMKNFLGAEVAYKQALIKAMNKEEQLSALKTLKNINLSINHIEAAYKYLKEELQIDGSPQNALSRMQLSRLSLQLKDHVTAESNLIKLMALDDFYLDAVFLLINMYKQTKNKKNTLKFLDKVASDVDQLTELQIRTVIEYFLEYNEVNKAKNIFEKIKFEYRYENWLVQVTDKIDRIQNKKVEKNINMPVSGEQQQFISGENKKVITLIKALVNELKKMGARFHQQLHIVEKSGDLSIQSSLPANTYHDLMNIPVKCMPLIGDFIFTVDADFNLFVQPVEKILNKHSVKIMELMVDIYNATGKLKTWNETYPLLTLRKYPKIVDLLLEGRTFNKKIKTYQELMKNERWDDLLIESFLGSRVFNYTDEMLKQAGIASTNDSESGLLAVIDFLNHRTGASSYTFCHSTKSILINACSDAKSKEVFIQYNLSDPLIAYVMYGFVDSCSPWIYSITTKLTTQYGKSELLVLNAPSVYKDKLDRETRHLRKFLPENIKSNGKNVAVSSLMIPNVKDHSTLREVLAVILKKYNLGGYYSNDLNLQIEVKFLEQQLIDNNIKYWSRLKEAITKSYSNTFPENSFKDLNLLCDFNLEHIYSYKNACLGLS